MRLILKVFIFAFSSMLVPSIGLGAESEPKTLMAPDFSLTDLNGKTHSLAQYKGKVVVIEFFNPECPFIKRAHTDAAFLDTIKDTQARGVVWLAINANAPGRQGASMDANLKGKENFGISYPILLNPTGEVGKAYGATRTPEMFVINENGQIVYRGGVDSSGGSRNPKDKVEYWLKNAINAHLGGQIIGNPTTKPWGCSVKY